MKKNTYICSAKPVERILPRHITSAIKRCSSSSKVFSSRFRKNKRGNASFCIHIKKFYDKMRNRVKFGFAAKNSNRVRFYGQTVLDGAIITSKKYDDATSAMHWASEQLNRECTRVYGITAEGEHIALNVQFC